MYFHIFKIRCITNLHVGSGDINYNVVDKEVEKDPVTGLPIIHASGIKGALLQHFKSKKMDEAKRNEIFGAEGKGEVSKPGAYRFLDAHLLARPMRTNSGAYTNINVTTAEIMQNFLNDIADLNKEVINKTIPEMNFKTSKFIATANVGIEGFETTEMTSEQKNATAWIKELVGDNYAFTDDMREYDLPIIARNHLNNGISDNLWYEEFVPHGSVFYMIILTPDEKFELDFESPIQIGGNASVGYGFTNIKKIDLATLKGG